MILASMSSQACTTAIDSDPTIHYTERLNRSLFQPTTRREIDPYFDTLLTGTYELCDQLEFYFHSNDGSTEGYPIPFFCTKFCAHTAYSPSIFADNSLYWVLSIYTAVDSSKFKSKRSKFCNGCPSLFKCDVASPMHSNLLRSHVSELHRE